MSQLVASAVLAWCVAGVLLATEVDHTLRDAHIRQKRYLVFTPYTHFIELILGFGIPISFEMNSLVLGPVFKYIYQLPYNATQFTQPYVTTAKREAVFAASRWVWYGVLEQAIDRFGLDGRACLLRAVCESAEAPVKHGNDILGELLHILLTPSTSDEAADSSVADYLSAEMMGSSQHPMCGSAYRECAVSLLGLVSQLGLAV